MMSHSATVIVMGCCLVRVEAGQVAVMPAMPATWILLLEHV